MRATFVLQMEKISADIIWDGRLVFGTHLSYWTRGEKLNKCWPILKDYAGDNLFCTSITSFFKIHKHSSLPRWVGRHVNCVTWYVPQVVRISLRIYLPSQLRSWQSFWSLRIHTQFFWTSSVSYRTRITARNLWVLMHFRWFVVHESMQRHWPATSWKKRHYTQRK